MDFWDNGSGTPRDTLYTRFYFKVGGPDFQNQSTGTKICYWSYANTVRRNQSYLMLRGDFASAASKPNGTVGSSWKIAWWISQMNATTGADPGFSSENIPNVNTSKLVVAGQWHLIEMLMIKNTGLNADGVAKLWIDGVLTHSLLKRFTSPTNSRGFYGVHKHEIWGGDNGQVRNRADNFYWDHLYASAA
jgi:hypothetical protein